MYQWSDPVGINEIAQHYGKDKTTVIRWTKEPDWPEARYTSVNSYRAWILADVDRWVERAVRDGRVRAVHVQFT